jgi:glycosyltransferase involved in cell wall biosynthesis
MDSVLLVVTRDISRDDDFGRPKILKSIIALASSAAPSPLFRVRSLLEQKSYGALCGSLLRRLLLVPKGRRWPLQCILFDDSKTYGRLEDVIREMRPAAIYFDTVRCFPFIRKVAQSFPDIRLICDFDDLMSRRMSLIRALAEKASFGYMDKWARGWMKKGLENRWLSNLVLEHEATTLSRTEAEIVELVDSIVLLSSVDADALRRNAAVKAGHKICAIPPPFVAKRPIAVQIEGLRFVFIGSDRLLQNRLSIEMLLNIWRQHRPSYPLYIYGHQSRSRVDCDNVFWPGYAKKLDEVYTPNSILIAPAVIGGGIKTKMLEALAFGTITLGNFTSFEGIGSSEGLAMTDEELVHTLAHLPDHIPFLTQAAQRMQDDLAKNDGVKAFESRWGRTFGVEAAS